MANKTLEFRYSVYDTDNLEPSEPSDITYVLPLSDSMESSELEKHFKRFLKAVGIR